MHEIDFIYDEICDKYPNLKLYCASWWLYDAKWKHTSDVDILWLTENPKTWNEIFKNIISVEIDWDRYVFSLWWYNREVYIFATPHDSDKRSLVHRDNEIMLNDFHLLTAQAIILKQNWYWTEPARAKVLWLDWDPYEATLNNNLYDVACKKECELINLLDQLPKQQW
jgi:hypothetical protein